MNNPLFNWYGIDPDKLMGRIWNIWDMINGSWLLNPSAVASRQVRTPKLNDDRLWVPDPNGQWMIEAEIQSFPILCRSYRSSEGNCSYLNQSHQ